MKVLGVLFFKVYGIYRLFFLVARIYFEMFKNIY